LYQYCKRPRKRVEKFAPKEVAECRRKQNELINQSIPSISLNLKFDGILLALNEQRVYDIFTISKLNRKNNEKYGVKKLKTLSLTLQAF